MSREFRPLFRNAYLSTIAANFWPREIDERRFPARRRLYETEPGIQILVVEHQPEATARGQIFFLHGLEGSGDAGYIKSFAQHALEHGFGVHRGNMRSCGGTEHLAETMYHSGLTSDTRVVLERIQTEHPGPLLLVGFSLGGNVALKLAGELGDDGPLTAVCAVSTPIDLAACVRRLDKPANRMFARRFLKRLKARIRRKSAVSPERYSAKDLDSVHDIWTFDDRYTAPLFGFGTAANYYATQSARNFLDAIRIPTLVIQAQDDPLIPFAVYDHAAFSSNPALELLTPAQGGHVGFLSRRRPRFWVDQVALGWFEELLDRLAAPPQGRLEGTKRSTFTSA